MDILTVSNNQDEYSKQDSAKLIWYENDGHSNFFKQTITDTVYGVRSIFAIDLDKDDDVDLLTIFYRYERWMCTHIRHEYVVWLENDGNQNFSANILKSLTYDFLKSIFAYDIEMDGDNDIVICREWFCLEFFENDGMMNFTDHNPITYSSIKIEEIVATDLDGDDYIDILSAEDWEIACYYNDYAYNNAVVYSRYPIVYNLDGGYRSVFPVDLDKDEDNDIISTICNKIVWLEYPNSKQLEFEEHIINENVKNPRSVYATDMDGDEDIDVISASYEDHTIAWYENDGTQNFIDHIISDTANGANFVFAADLDKDNDIDVLAASLIDSTIIWYENLKSTGIAISTPDSIKKDLQLYNNYPNPFNTSTIINYEVGATRLDAGQDGYSPLHVELSIFNVLGQRIATLVSQTQQAGFHQVTWDANGMASGVYLYRLSTDQGFIQTRKLVLLR
jgi:hypothetical protein